MELKKNLVSAKWNDFRTAEWLEFIEFPEFCLEEINQILFKLPYIF